MKILNKREFDDIAYGLCNLFDEYSKSDQKIHEKLSKQIPSFNINCLELAFLGRRERFLGSACVQNNLNRVWLGVLPNIEGPFVIIKVRIFE
jgi:hypothetical protein